MDELTKTINMAPQCNFEIPMDDIEYLTSQSNDKINMIVSQMTSLMRSTDKKVANLESQSWFTRMWRTITGKNKATKEEIARNHDKINAYMTKAMSALYDKQLIDEKILMNLGWQINMLCADHVQLKKQLGAFAYILNQKIESVDNFHLLSEEINIGHYSNINPITAVCEITSLFDERILKGDRQLSLLKETLEKHNIINDEQIAITDYLNSVFELPADAIGQVAMELGTIYQHSMLAKLMLNVLEEYHYLPEMTKKMKKKDGIVASILQENEIDESFSVSTREMYDDFVNCKQDTVAGLLPVENAVLPPSDMEDGTTDNATDKAESTENEVNLTETAEQETNNDTTEVFDKAKLSKIRRLCVQFYKNSWDSGVILKEYGDPNIYVQRVVTRKFATMLQAKTICEKNFPQYKQYYYHSTNLRFHPFDNNMTTRTKDKENIYLVFRDHKDEKITGVITDKGIYHFATWYEKERSWWNRCNGLEFISYPDLVSYIKKLKNYEIGYSENIARFKLFKSTVKEKQKELNIEYRPTLNPSPVRERICQFIFDFADILKE